MKYNFNDLRIDTAINPDTQHIAFAAFVKKDDGAWKTYYVAEEYSSNGLDEVIEFIKAWHPAANVLYGGEYIPASNL